jgi:hypothetical protein
MLLSPNNSQSDNALRDLISKYLVLKINCFVKNIEKKNPSFQLLTTIKTPSIEKLCLGGKSSLIPIVMKMHFKSFHVFTMTFCGPCLHEYHYKDWTQRTQQTFRALRTIFCCYT